MGSNSNMPSPIAATGDMIKGADLQQSIATLNARAASLNDAIRNAQTVEDAQQALRMQQDLLSQATSLLTAQINLIAGTALVTADQVNAAITYTDAKIKTVTMVSKRLALTAKLLDFVAAVFTGNGTAMFAAAKDLKVALDNTCA